MFVGKTLWYLNTIKKICFACLHIYALWEREGGLRQKVGQERIKIKSAEAEIVE